MLLVQVFSETYKVLIVGGPLELQVNATDSFELRSFGTPFAKWVLNIISAAPLLAIFLEKVTSPSAFLESVLDGVHVRKKCTL